MSFSAGLLFYFAFPGAIFMASQALVNRGWLAERARGILLRPSDALKDAWRRYDELSTDQMSWLSRHLKP